VRIWSWFLPSSLVDGIDQIPFLRAGIEELE